MKTRAFLVHLLTASGLIPIMLSVDAIWQGDAHLALLWLAVALMIDGLDGPLARRFEVGKHWPMIDGAVLDHVIDYVAYCFVPALMIYRFGLVPSGWELPTTMMLLMTSLYTFANRALKTAEYDFRGFPALWNIVVFYMIVFETAASANLAIIGVLSVMVFAPIRVIHPIRVVSMRWLTLPILALWAVCILAYLTLGRAGLPVFVDVVFFAMSFYFVGLCAWRSWRLYRETD